MSTAIVTGASRGLGLALATGLAGAGWRLVVDARGAEDLALARDRIGGEVIAVVGDLTDERHRAELAAAAESLGGPDLLVNNAGILGASPLPRLADYPLAALREAYEVNVVAQLGLIQSVLPALRSRGGAIANVTSDAAAQAFPGWGGYGSTKAALDQLGRVLAVEEPSVPVWQVDPGDLRTRMHEQAFPGEDISDRPGPDSVVAAFLRLVERRPAAGRVRLAEPLPAI